MSPPLPELFRSLCDDAAVFPPGNMPLADAVPAHRVHRGAPYADVVGSFVLAAKDLTPLADLTRGLAPGSLPLSLTTTEPAAVADALEAARRIPAVQLVGLEVAVPEGIEVSTVVPTLQAALRAWALPTYVELPRDGRRDAVVEQLVGSGYLAKMRTGGIRADLYPDEQELADSLLAVVRAGVPFKATAGLHHALRNTDPEAGFEQHGFLNVMLAVAAAVQGSTEPDLVDLLATRDPQRVATDVRNLDPTVREAFHSFGTCSIGEPVAELVHYGLLPTDRLTDELMEAFS